jgi:hypothetical protein
MTIVQLCKKRKAKHAVGKNNIPYAGHAPFKATKSQQISRSGFTEKYCNSKVKLLISALCATI